MRTRPLALVVLVLALVTAGVATSTTAAAQTPGQLTGNLPASGGFGLVVWGGGDTNALRAAAAMPGCTLASVFVTASGDFVGYIYGAPDFVNRPFLGLYAGGNITAGTPMIAVCRAPAPPPDVNLQLSQAVADRINSARQARGLPALHIDTRLTSAAAKYAKFLFDFGYPARTADASGNTNVHFFDGSPQDRVGREGYATGVGETIYFRMRDTSDANTIAGLVVQGWIDSPPHNAIMFGVNDPYRDVGAGCFRGPNPDIVIICVADFGLGG